MAELRPKHRIFCWTSPRSLSTVFMKCLSTIEGAIAWLEPFATAEHFGPEGRLPQPGEALHQEPEYTPALLKEKLEGDFGGHSLVFVKDFAYSVTDRFQFLPKGYRHSFIIRHPLKSLMSFYRVFKRLPGGDDDENLRDWLPRKGFGYGELVELAVYVEKDLGQPLVIVDADDVVEHPDVILEKYCGALGLPFSPAMLTWEAGMPNNWIVARALLDLEDKGNWMMKTLRSCGFQKDVQYSSSSEEIPQVVREMVKVAQPFYNKLTARQTHSFLLKYL